MGQNNALIVAAAVIGQLKLPNSVSTCRSERLRGFKMQKTASSILVFWLVAILALIWNGMGCLNFLWQISASGQENLPLEYRDFARTRPFWATTAFGLSVLAGLIAVGFLIFRGKLAARLFLVSMLAAFVTLVHALGSGASPIIAGSAMSTILAGFFAWFAHRSAK